MTAAAHESDRPNVLVGYDGSSDAANAVTIGARLLPGSAARVVHVAHRHSLVRTYVVGCCEPRPVWTNSPRCSSAKVRPRRSGLQRTA